MVPRTVPAPAWVQRGPRRGTRRASAAPASRSPWSRCRQRGAAVTPERPRRFGEGDRRAAAVPE
eukprot:11552-Prymnesium_polylepis.1